MAKRILVVGPSWIGDMVMAQSLFIFLKQQNPDCLIDVIAPKWPIAVLARMSEVNQAIVLDIKHGKFGLVKRFKLGRQLKNNNYHQAIIIPRSLKSALVPFFAQIPQRTGFLGEQRFWLLNDIRPLDKNVLSQTVTKMLSLGLEKNCPPPPKVPYPKLNCDSQQQEKLKQQFALKNQVLGLFPGAEYGKAKQWPIKYFIEVAKLAGQDGFQVLVFGSEKDAKFGEKIADKSKALNLCGKTSLSETIDLIGACQQVICNDSGLMHIAASLGVKVVAIYGSSDPKYTPPLTDKSAIHYLNLKCSPCFARMCKFNTYECLEYISPNQVYQPNEK